MTKLIMTKGLPASGKSTWAQERYDNNPGSTKIICKDDLRNMLDCGRWSRAREEFIITARNTLVTEALMDGYDVVVADTNLAEKHANRLEEIAESVGGVEFEIKDFTDVPLKECIKRDKQRGEPVGEDVIHRMWRQHLAEPHEPVEPIVNPPAIIIDVDGTLAYSHGVRNPYNGERCDEDRPNKRLMRVIDCISDDYTKIILTGREDQWEQQTKDWLEAHGVEYDEFYMRATGDNRKDAIIKKEIYDEHIKPRYQVDLVFDDRPQVIDMWKEEGLLVADVGEGIDF